MTRRAFLISSVISTVLVTSSSSANTPQLAGKLLLSRSWQHVSTMDNATGGDVSTLFPSLIGNLEYLNDGTYVFGNGADKGVWNLSTDGRRLSVSSATFEYTVELTVVRLDASTLQLMSKMVATDGIERRVVETFKPRT